MIDKNGKGLKNANDVQLSEQELYTQISNKLESSSSDFTNILNSFIEPIFERDELLSKLLKYVHPNETTHLNLINCYLKIANYEEANIILSQQKKNLSVGGLIFQKKFFLISC